MSTSTVTPEAPTPLTGVRGWLLFFVIVMFFNAFIEFLATFDAGYGAVFTVPLFGLALAAGVQLARRDRLGVVLAKVFLYANWGTAALASVGAVALAGRDPSGIVMLQAIIYLFRATLFGGIWLAYLYRSERVRNTYGS